MSCLMEVTHLPSPRLRATGGFPQAHASAAGLAQKVTCPGNLWVLENQDSWSPTSSNTLLSPSPRCGHPTWLRAPLSHLLSPPSLWSLVWKWPSAVPNGHGWVTGWGDSLWKHPQWDLLGRGRHLPSLEWGQTLIRGALVPVTCIFLEGWGSGWELGLRLLHRYPVTGEGERDVRLYWNKR